MPPLVLIRGIGSGRSSPDSWWRRFIIVTASRKSDRSFIGAFLLICSVLYINSSDICRTLNGSGLSFANLSIAMHVSSVQPILSCVSTLFCPIQTVLQTISSELRSLLEKYDQPSFQGIRECLFVPTEFIPFPFENPAHSKSRYLFSFRQRFPEA